MTTKKQKQKTKRQTNIRSKSKLNTRQERFAAEYSVDQNGAAAARRAGYSKKNARISASQLLTNVNVRETIEENIETTLKKLGITRERIMKEYRRLAFANNKKVMTWGPNGVLLKDSDKLSREDSAAVAEVSETTSKDGGSLRLKMHDKKGALDALAKMSRMFVEKIEVTGKDGGPLQLEGISDEELSTRAKEALELLAKEKVQK